MEIYQRAGEMNFSLYNREDDYLVERVTHSQFLGRTLDHTENDYLDMHRNIGKGRAVWRRLVMMLQWEGWKSGCKAYSKGR